MNEKILRALVEAGAVKKIKITAEGSTIYVEAYTGSEPTTAKTIKGKLKTWSTIDSAAKFTGLNSTINNLARSNRKAARGKNPPKRVNVSTIST
jgi:hypothetical protein